MTEEIARFVKTIPNDLIAEIPSGYAIHRHGRVCDVFRYGERPRADSSPKRGARKWIRREHREQNNR